MNPFRFLALIGRGILGAAERFFGHPPEKGTLYGALSQYLGEHESITQAEATEVGGVVSRAVQAGSGLTNIGSTLPSSIPTIPSTEEDVGYLYRVAVNVTVPSLVPGAAPVTERIIVPVITSGPSDLDTIMRLAEQAARTTYRERTTPEYLRALLGRSETEVEGQQVIAAYNNLGQRID